MISEKETSKIDLYLMKLGYLPAAINHNVMVQHGQEAEVVVYASDQPYIVGSTIDERDFPKYKTFADLQFNPHVRQAQFFAHTLNAPYFLLSDGRNHIWFTTDDNGRPQLLNQPILPSTLSNVRPSKAAWVRIFQELRSHFYRYPINNPFDEVAVALYAWLLHEKGQPELLDVLLQSRNDADIFDRLNIPAISNSTIKDKRYYDGAFEILGRIDFKKSIPEDILLAMDEALLDQQKQSIIRIPRWLTDFMFQLGNTKDNDIVFDMSSNLGDIYVASALAEHHSEIWTICPNSRSALWARIQQLIVNKTGKIFDYERIIVDDIPPYSTISSNNIPRPNCIILTPPFGVKFNTSRLPSNIVDNNGWSEEVYMEIALQQVAINGRVVALMPERILFSDSASRLRRYLLEQTHIVAIISLGTFLPQSSLKTSLLIIDKKPQNQRQNIKTLISNIPKLNIKNKLNSKSFPELQDFLLEFESWNRGVKISVTSFIAEVLQSELDEKNLTALQYLRGSTYHNITGDYTYPLVPLSQIVIEIKRGSGIVLEETGELAVIGPASIRPMFIDEYNLDRTTQAKLTPNPVLVSTGDVVLNAISTHRGAAAVVEQKLGQTFISRNVIVLRPQLSMVLPRYLAAAINSRYVKEQIDQITTGSLIPAITVKLLKDIAIPLPNLDEQSAILNEIDIAYEKVSSAKELLEQVEAEYNRAIHSLGTGGKEK